MFNNILLVSVLVGLQCVKQVLDLPAVADERVPHCVNDGRSDRFKIEGDKLSVETARGPSILFPGKTSFGRLVFERDK
jgi:hypothetical protein